MFEIVRQTPVRVEGRELTVSTVRIGPRYYDTVVFDDSDDRRHNGQTVGRWVIDKLSVRSDDREAAMDVHREALHTARTEPIRETAPAA
jgi:hypothetical protein